MKSLTAIDQAARVPMETRGRFNRKAAILCCIGIVLEIVASALCHLLKKNTPFDEILALAAMICFVWAALLFTHRNLENRRITACVIGASVLILFACVLDVTGGFAYFDESLVLGNPRHFHKILHDTTLTVGLALLLASFGLASLQAYRAQWRLEEQNEELRRETRERMLLASATEQSAEALVITDPRGVIQYVNSALESLTGYGRDELIGETSALFRGNGGYYRDVWLAISQGKTWRGHVTLRRKDGTECEVDSVVSCVFDDSGAIVNYIGAHHDVTVQASLERQLRQSQKMEVLGTFAGHIAHDFNNILTLILGHCEMALQRLPEQDPVSVHVQRIEKAGRRASNLAKQILAFSRQSEQQQKPVPMHLVVGEVLDFLRASLPSTIHLQESVDDCGMVMADATQIHQVVMNLCTNAYQALQNRQGTIEVTLETAEIGPEFESVTSQTLRPGDYVRLRVRDTGEGIDTEILPYIFDPFFTTKKPGEGTGLGLSTVHGIVGGHGGAIAVQSEAGRGSRFEVYLPKLAGESQPADLVWDPPVGGSERILLVDDSEEIAEMSAMSLEQMGYSVRIFGNSLEALEAFRQNPHGYDLVITDQVMPDMTGVVLARELLRIRPGLPIILVSGFGQGLTPEQTRAVGIADYLTKPFTMKTLGHAIRRALGDGKKPAITAG